MSNDIAVLEQDIYAIQSHWESVAVVPTAKFEREAGFAIQLLQGNDYLARIAASNRQSLVNAVTNLAALGVTLNPAKKQAYLVPRDGRVCLDVSYMGLIDLAVECGSIAWAQAQLVYETESLQIQGFDKPPIHTRNPFAKDRGEVVGAYCVARLASGDYLTETMTREELDAVRDRSSGWKAWIKDKKKCPWVTDPGEMMRKTVVKRASKYWPRTNGSRIEAAIHHLNVDGDEGIADLVEAAPTGFDANAWIEKAKAAKTADELVDVYSKGIAIVYRVKDGDGGRKFKAACTQRRNELLAANTIENGASE